MAFLNPAVAEGIRVVVRQATETTASALSTAVTDPSFTASPTRSATTSTSSSSTSSAPSPSDTYANGGPPNGGPGNNNNNNGGGSNSSPLLFFVALGFGVVFTNLW